MKSDHANRLSRETSPYLLQHQHNPVDWYPWGEEAFETARRENKPIFLSVGYSTCYWCHVMERQSFENEQIAGEMNRRFINIKVDREERPDVDQLYMTAVQVLTRHGGWPMSVFLMPDLRPFYGGTYFPPADQHGRPGFPTLLRAIEDAYQNRRDDVDKSAEQLLDILQQLAEPAVPATPVDVDAKFIHSLVDRSTSDFDPQHGGFGSAPKFPRQTLLEMLLVHHRHFPDPRRMEMITATLDALANGGIRDHLGGGFHRYSTDAQWLVPHFEIMLYDNAMLGWCYVEAFEQTDDDRYAAVARGIFDFVLREMTSPEGGFYTAFDAEVDAQEGLSYLWTRAEVQAILAESLGGSGDAGQQINRFCRVYGLDDGPNFADPHHGSGRAEQNILFLAHPDDARQSALLDPDLAKLRDILYSARRQRTQPLLDTKIITSWNGLMIRALAFGGQVLKVQKYIDAANRAAEYILNHHRTADGGLHRTSRDGKAKHAAFLDDYAFLIQAMLALHAAGTGEIWKEQAGELCRALQDRFGDAPHGGFFFTEKGARDLIVRQKIGTDSPLPSGNAVAAMVLLESGQKEAARNTIAAFAQPLERNAEAMSSMLQAALLYVLQDGPFTVTADQKLRATETPSSPREAAEVVVTLTADWPDAQTLLIQVKISTGFHINAHQAGAGLIATRLTVTGQHLPPITAIEYPEGEPAQFPFADQPIRVYSRSADITVRFASPPVSGEELQVAVTYQACDDQACLMPVTKTLQAAVGCSAS